MDTVKKVKFKEHWVPMREDAEKYSYFKHIVEVEPLSEEFKMKLMNSLGNPEDALDPNERIKLQELKRWPENTGYYYPKTGGLLVASNVKIPHLTKEMLAWYSMWYPLEPLRYAVWDPEDHYDAQICELGHERAFDPTIPLDEKHWGVTYRVSESFDRDEPGTITMTCLSPEEAGFDQSLYRTPRSEYMIICRVLLNDEIPIFLVENFCKDENDEMEARLRFWVGYVLGDDGNVNCVLPSEAKVPEIVAQMLLVHNFKEFQHLDKILPKLYEDEKDHWGVEPHS